MKISCVVPAFNEEKLLHRTLAAIKQSSKAFESMGWAFELIVCDNNSTDRTSSVAGEAGAIVVFEPINQIGRARNCGAAAATGDWLVFVDADSQPSHGLFEDVARQISSGRVVGGGSTVRFDRSEPLFAVWVLGWNFLSRACRWAAGSFIYCEASAFKSVGGFSLDLYASEELDLSKRLKRLGRQHGKKFVILRRHPLTTSARKIDLYSGAEIRRFLGLFLRRPKGTLKDPEACHIWYDGRR